MGRPMQGRKGRFQVNSVPGGGVSGQNANVEQFTCELSIDRVWITGFGDTNPTTSLTNQRLGTGVSRAVVNVKGYLDGDALPPTFNFIQGGLLTNVKLFFRKNTAICCITLSEAIVFKINYQGNVKDKFVYDLNIESSGGTLTYPVDTL